ncbi:SOS response-associated peptidase family protein [Rubrivivax gelatinosus]|uniref:SOS response-associated peptidase YedK n=1 Tax=Rubrivivax gelatinosus (strain NBRC 100245 / IL144) TaxID=983917 RepID=I0HQ65_RUBGI|nr:SOS response-associated peptidase family protein [Rubrivivax gelatinosus]BAL95152.1 hypothetical protein RGE_18110 [Rubrivivax gelatinosus IL144]
MCYSAMVVADYIRYTRDYGVELSIQDFYELFHRRHADPRIKIPKAMELGFAGNEAAAGQQINALIAAFNAEQTIKLEQELFKQRKRLADAQRSLAAKVTKTAADSERIASDKVRWALAKLADLRRTTLEDRDARIFPGHYAPVIVIEGGRRVLKPMRYQCRPAGKPAFYDQKYPGTYNARRDNLGGFWKDLFGYSHGLMLVNAFFENVDAHKVQGRELAEGEKPTNVVLEFRPQPVQDMLVACLWSRWSAPGEPELLSFAAITDEPPPEVAAAGHDRCIVPIRPEHIDAWLSPDPKNLKAQFEILDDRARPYYEHRLAA